MLGLEAKLASRVEKAASGFGHPNLPRQASRAAMRVVLQIRVPFRVLFIRVPYDLGPRKGALIESTTQRLVR